MVELNLLPDVKLQFIKAKQVKRLVFSISIIVAVISLAILVSLIVYVDVVQKSKINTLNKSIASSIKQIQGNKDLNSVLTIQDQLRALPQLEAQSPKTSRLFGYMSSLVPSNVTVSSLSIDYTKNTIMLSGNADSLATVNQFVDTLKFTTYNTDTVKNAKAFNTVVLSSVTFGSGTASYSISFNFDPILFSSTQNVTLVVPNLTTTRSIIDQPKILFKSSGN